MKDEIMKFPSELIQKELAKDPAKLLNSLNNVKEIPSKKNNNIEQNTKEEKKYEKNMLSIISNSKEKIYSKQEIDSVEKNKNDINTNLNFFNIKNVIFFFMIISTFNTKWNFAVFTIFVIINIVEIFSTLRTI